MLASLLLVGRSAGGRQEMIGEREMTGPRVMVPATSAFEYGTLKVFYFNI